MKDADRDGRYWNDEEQTHSVMKKDEQGTLWMHTGDEGIMDEEGYLQSEFYNQKLDMGQSLISYGSRWKDQGTDRVILDSCLTSFPTCKLYLGYNYSWR